MSRISEMVNPNLVWSNCVQSTQLSLGAAAARKRHLLTLACDSNVIGKFASRRVLPVSVDSRCNPPSYLSSLNTLTPKIEALYHPYRHELCHHVCRIHPRNATK